MERRALLRRCDLPRSKLEKILLDRFAEMQAAKPVGRQNALFLGGVAAAKELEETVAATGEID